MKPVILPFLLLSLMFPSIPATAQLLTPVTTKDILPAVTTAAESGFSADAKVTNALFVSVSYQGITLALDHETGKATGWVFRFYSESLDSVLFYIGVRVPVVGDVALPLALDTLTQNLPISLGKTPLQNPWVDSDVAISGSMQGGAGDFYTNNPDGRVELAILINNPTQNEYIPQGQYWLFRNVAANDTMTCMVHASSGQSFTCISGDTPSILSNPPTTGRVGDLYMYKVQAFGNPLPFYYLDQKPDGMTIDIRTGLISWTPSDVQAGANVVIVRATNDAGSDTQQFTINVQGIATAPVITSTPVTEAIADRQYQYQVRASGSPSPQFSLPQLPSGMVIDPNRGTIHWTPKRAQVGTHAVSVLAENSAGSNTQSYNLEVFSVPLIDAIPPQQGRAKRLFQYTATANARPDATFSLVAGPSGLTIGSSGLIEWTPTVDQAGINNVQIKATNVYGFDLKSFTIDVDGTVGVDPAGTALNFHLGQHYPNPIIAGTTAQLTIPVELRAAGDVRYDVHDVLGRLVCSGSADAMPAGRGLLRMDVGGLRTGTYVFSVHFRGESGFGRFTVAE